MNQYVTAVWGLEHDVEYVTRDEWTLNEQLSPVEMVRYGGPVESSLNRTPTWQCKKRKREREHQNERTLSFLNINNKIVLKHKLGPTQSHFTLSASIESSHCLPRGINDVNTLCDCTYTVTIKGYTLECRQGQRMVWHYGPIMAGTVFPCSATVYSELTTQIQDINRTVINKD